MLKYIVLFKFRDPEECLPTVIEKLHSMEGVIPEILSMETGADIWHNGARSYDLALTCTFRDMELPEQLGIVDLNARALTAMCHISIPYMTRGSKIVNLGSNSSWQPVPYMSVYGASKAYVLSFSRALGRELKKDGIGVLCVCPGWVRTEFMDRAVRDNTISFFDRWYESKDVVDRAMRDLRRGKSVSVLGFPVRMQVRLVKHLPVDTVMNIWCKQQKKEI